MTIASTIVVASSAAVGQNQGLDAGMVKSANVAPLARKISSVTATAPAVGRFGGGGGEFMDGWPSARRYTSSVAGFSSSSRTVARYWAAIAPSTIR